MSSLKRSYSVPYVPYNNKRSKTLNKPTGLTGPVTAKIRSMVRKTIAGEAEKKSYIVYAANQSIITSSATSPFAVFLAPQVAQGGGDGQRIGNKIKVLKQSLRICINLLPYNAVSNPLPPPLLIRILIVGYKKANVNAIGTTDASTALFEVNAGVTGPQGNPLDITLSVNDQSFTTYYDRVIKLGATSTSATTPVNSGAYFDASDMTQYMEIDVKHVGMFQYNDTTNVPTNKNTFLLIQPVTADGQASGALTMAECHYTIKTIFTDI